MSSITQIIDDSSFYIGINNMDRDDCQYLAKTYDQKIKLGKGASGEVYELCKKGTTDCNYVLKVTIYKSDIYDMTGQIELSKEYKKSEWQKEVKILTKLNNCQNSYSTTFVPIIYDNWLCDENDKTYFYIVMEKFHGNLNDFIKKNKSNEQIKIAAVKTLELLTLQLRIIHNNCNVCLVDIKLDNILYKQIDTYTYEFVFADIGSAIDKANIECKQIDTERFLRTIQLFKNNL